MNSLRILNANRQLMILPILSGLTLLMVLASFLTGFSYITSLNRLADTTLMYIVLFVFYLISYFIIVFFNMALIHCTTLYFKGEDASVSKGLAFSANRIGLIFMWAVFSATIGTLLKAIQDNLGWAGKIVAGLIGFVWSAATFFAIPIIAYEQLNPVSATKRSISLMKEKWGAAVTANFSFNLIILLGFLIMGIAATAVSELVNESLGIGLFAGGMGFMIVMISAIKSIIVSATYHDMYGNLDTHFNRELLTDLFVAK